MREILAATPVIPVIRIDDPASAVPLARALVAGGLHVLEITLRTEQAFAAVERILADVPEAITGIGTVRQPDDLHRASALGAHFAVSPGLTPALAEAATTSGLPLLPGVMTPSEILRAQEAGFDSLKLFPAEPAGGLAMLKALAGPFPDIRFCPTGGITPANLPDYLALPNVPCVGGSWLTPAEAVAHGDWPRITRLAEEAIAAANP